MGARDVEKLTSFLPHLKKIQQVDFTFNFAHSTIAKALMKIAEDDRTKFLSSVHLNSRLTPDICLIPPVNGTLYSPM